MKRYAKLSLPLFIFWPFGAFVLSLFNLKSKSSALVFILFCTVFGYSFSFEFTSADSYRIALVFNNYSFSSLGAVFEAYRAGFLTDLYINLMYGITKSNSNNPKVLYAYFGFVFGLFSYLSVRLLLKEKGKKNSLLWGVIVFIFFITNTITNVNGARFFTAAWVFFYSVMNLFFFGKKRWLLGVLITPLIHFSYLAVLIPIVLFYIFKRFMYSNGETYRWVFIMFTASFFISMLLETNSFSIGFLTDSSLLSGSLTRKLSYYNSAELSETIENRSGSLFLVVSKYFGYIKKIYYFILLLVIYRIIKKLELPPNNLNKLLAFTLFFLSFGYLISVFPSAGRFINIGFLFTLFLFARLYYLVPSRKLQRLALWSLPVHALNIFFHNAYLPTLLASSTLWYGNLFWIIWEGIGFEFIYR